MKRAALKRSEFKRTRTLRRRRAALRPIRIKTIKGDESKSSQPTQLSRRKPTRTLSAGRRMKEWGRVWAWLKPKLESAGRTGCEFDFLVHDCGGPLDPAHSKKRFKMQDMDIYTVALACRTVHDYLDGLYEYPPLGRRMDHAEMEAAVCRAIDEHGGLVLPERRAAA